MAGILVGNSSSNEAVGSLGFKGERGYSAYEIAVQHGYVGTEDEWLASKNEKWQDEGGVEVKFFKGDTDDIEDRAIINGQLLYNTETGETSLDDNGNRIVTGSGNVISVDDIEPTNPATKLWINPDEPLNSVGTEVVDSMSGNETNMAPSVSSVKGYVEEAYSTSEVKTNKVWTNGKPLYRKTYHFTLNIEASTTMKTYSINHLIDNIETIMIDYSHSYEENGGSFYPIVYGYSTNSGTAVQQRCLVGTSAIQIQTFASTAISNEKFCITVEYTKTTD